MKTFRTFAALALTFLAFAATAPAQAQVDRDGFQRWLDVVNVGNRPIEFVYLTDVGTDSWGADRLGSNEVISPGASRRVLPSGNQRGRGFCVYDFRVVFEGGAAVERRRINLCEASTVRCNQRSCSVQ